MVAQIVTIPDPNFKQALLDHVTTIDTNGDGEIQVSEALAVTQIIVNSSDISDMTGIEAFTNLTRLFCGSNPITTIDVSHNVDLIQLGVYYTDLETLDISQNTDLYTLRIYNTLITEIDVSNHPNLEMISASYSSLEILDVSNNPNLIYLDINNTNVQTIDISGNTNLEYLSLLDTGVDLFDFSFLPNLKILYLGGNTIESYNFSENNQLCSIFLKDNYSLEFVNLQNGANELLLPNSGCAVNLTYGGSSATSGLFAQNNNPSLQSICVDNIAFAEENFILIPPQTVFTESCNLSAPDHALSIINYYPNPMIDYLDITANSTMQSVQVYSMLGQELSTRMVDNSEVRLDVRELAIGTYFVTVNSQNGSEVFQVIKK